MLPERIPMIDTLGTEIYSVPEVEKNVEVFKGANFNLGELQRQLAKSKSNKYVLQKKARLMLLKNDRFYLSTSGRLDSSAVVVLSTATLTVTHPM